MAKVWLVVVRGDADARSDDVEDEVFAVVYRRLASAQAECRRHVSDIWGEEVETDAINWAETTQKGDKNRRLVGIPEASVDGSFEVYQAEVV